VPSKRKSYKKNKGEVEMLRVGITQNEKLIGWGFLISMLQLKSEIKEGKLTTLRAGNTYNEPLQ